MVVEEETEVFPDGQMSRLDVLWDIYRYILRNKRVFVPGLRPFTEGGQNKKTHPSHSLPSFTVRSSHRPRLVQERELDLKFSP